MTPDSRPLDLCVEFPADRPEWVEELPPTPAGRVVTMSFAAAALRDRDATVVTDLGYRVVGVAAPAQHDDVAHLLVSWDVVARHERWWRTVLDAARRVYDLRFGPVQQVLAEVIDLHAHATTSTDGRWPPVAGGR